MDQSALTPSLQELSSAEFAVAQARSLQLPWAELLAEDKWDQALYEIESALNSAPNCAKTRLWWVRCQIAQQSVPVTALSSPLEEITTELKDASAEHGLASSTFLTTGLALSARKQSRLALGMYERALEFARLSDCLSLPQLQGLEELYLNSLNQEIADAPLRRESKQYLASLEEKKAAEEQQRAKKKPAPKPEEKAKKSGSPFNSKAILAQAAEAEQSAEGAQAAAQVAETPVEDAKFPGERSPKRQLLLILAAIASISIVGTGIVLGSWALLFPGTQNELGNTQSARASLTPPAIPLAVPDPEKSKASSVSNSSGEPGLDKVGARLQQLAMNKKDGGTTGNKEDPSGETYDPNDVKNLDPTLGQKLPDSRPMDELVSISKLPSASNGIRKNELPQVDPDKFSKTKVERVGTSGRKAPAPNNTEKKALDGSPLKAYKVERFDPPLVFKTITQTEVLAAPSLLAKSLVRLENNTPVYVTRRMGRWLELLSTEGNVGYIYAQDAEEGK